MAPISDAEIQQIVQRVTAQLSGSMAKAVSPPSPAQPAAAKQTLAAQDPSAGCVIAVGADHGGYAMKEVLEEHLKANGYTVVDCGTNSTQAVDYPDFAEAVARKVAGGEAWRGIIVDGAGIGSCMAANKVRGVRAALCYDYATAVNSREHNDANVLTLGAGLIGLALAKQIADTWLRTEFGGGRHAGRVDKIMSIEGRSAIEAANGIR
ncbi:MAG: ribose 5-phosphate isomerase B [Anaerolineales bacterium]|nr:MAG: ribose 5-phosphate isomerase B [Anaerolineales bacterium]